MNKRITSILLCFVMVFSMLATAVPTYAATGKSVNLTMTADKDTAHPGDTINYTVKLGAVEDLLGIRFKLIIPDGLTFIDGKEVEGIDDVLNASSAEFKSDKLLFLADPEYTGTSDVTIMTFSCKVDDSVIGDKTVQMYIIDPDDWYDSDGDNIAVVVSNKTVSVTARPISVNGVTIQETLSILTGEKKTPTYTVSPNNATNKAVTFSSNNTAVATVNATTGEVTGVKAGSATITIKTTDGNFSDTCIVSVSCGHTKTAVSAKASTCNEYGWSAYSKCTTCNLLFNAAGTEVISGIPYLTEYGDHTEKTPATCTAKAVCAVCNQSYGEKNPNNHSSSTLVWVTTDDGAKHVQKHTCCNALDASTKADHGNWVQGVCGVCGHGCSHSFTAENQAASGALKTLGTCSSEAVYYKSCSICGTVASSDAYTFKGVKDSSNHNPEATWTQDAANNSHYHKCLYGCGTKLDETSCSGGEATCTDKATCSVCNKTYGATNPANHNPAATWTQDATTEKHYHVCQNGCSTRLNETACSGGVATCTDKAVCDDCNMSYGEKDPANHANSNLEWRIKNQDEHQQVRACCGVEVVRGGHTWNNGVCSVCSYACQHNGGVATCTDKAVCDDCGMDYGEKNANNHTGSLKWIQTATTHKQVYDCGCNTVVVNEASHIWGNDTVCDTCGYGCTHSYQNTVDAKYLKTPATCISKAEYWKSCEHCGQTHSSEYFTDTTGNFATHTPSDWRSDGTDHWKVCTVVGCGVEISGSKAAHVNSTLKSDATHHWHDCTVCGKTHLDDAVHDYSDDWKTNAQQHWHACADCGARKDIDNHVDTDKDYKCDTCAYQMRRPSSGGHYSHYDHNSDGKCDYCGVKFTCKHTDANKDGFCDSCGYKTVESSETFDAGIAMYVGMSVLAATGSAVVISKKHRNK